MPSPAYAAAVTKRTAPRPGGSPETIRRLRAGTDQLTTAALDRLGREVDWYTGLTAEDRSWLGLVAQTGFAHFISWYENPEARARNAEDIFRTAPPGLARAITLQQTIQLVRVLVEVVEERAVQLAEPDQREDLHLAVLVYARDVAFSAAEVYAQAAELRGAWDARLEAQVVDSLLRGGSDSALRSRVAALGWSGEGSVAVVVGSATANLDERRTAELRRAARRAAHDSCVGIHGDRVVLVLGGTEDIRAAAESLLGRFGPGPVVMGPAVKDIGEAGRSARAALAGFLAVRGWPGAPRLLAADELLPERMLNGDPLARHTLVHDLYQPLLAAGAPLAETLEGYLAQGRSLEAAARALYVHPNTVRYRLRRIGQVVGWDPTDPREGFVLQVAMTVGRLAENTSNHTGL